MTDQAKARAIKEIREAIANYEITKVQLAELADCHPDTVRRMVKGVPGSRGIRASTLQTLIKALGTHRTKMAAASRVKPGTGNGGSRHMRTRKDGELPPAVGFPVEAWEREDVQPTKAERAAELPPTARKAMVDTISTHQESLRRAAVASRAIRTELDAALLELEEAEQLITMGTRRAGRAKAAIVRALSKLGAAP